jgi:protein-S-isoprenylcysteine O-methyltransferase Ste14
MFRTYVLLFRAAFLMTGNRGIGSGGLSVIAVPMTAGLIKEEPLPVNRFGREYETYCGRTGKFSPRRGNGREAV